MLKGYGTAVFEWLQGDYLTEFRMIQTFHVEYRVGEGGWNVRRSNDLTVAEVYRARRDPRRLTRDALTLSIKDPSGAMAQVDRAADS